MPDCCHVKKKVLTLLYQQLGPHAELSTLPAAAVLWSLLVVTKSSLYTNSKAWALAPITQATNKQMTPILKQLALMHAKQTTL